MKKQRFGSKWGYKRKQRNTSVYFLLLTAFFAVVTVMVLLFGVTQQYYLVKTHKEVLARELTEKGKRVQTELNDARLQANVAGFSAYVRYLGYQNGVDIFILAENGEVLYPISDGDEEAGVSYDFKKEVKQIKDKLDGTSGVAVVYEGERSYIYGAPISVRGQACVLYVGHSLDIVEGVTSQMTVRTVMLSLFMLVLVFVVASGISGWLTKPIVEITEKAKLFAQGNFDVDFHGSDYGSEMVELARTLNFARDEISKADNMQKQLIANVSHDFKTPLTMIKAYASMIMEISGAVPEKRNKHAQVIVDEADRLTSLVEDVLDLSKIRSGINAISPKTFDLSAYLYEILGRFEYLKDTQGYRFSAQIEDGLNVFADEGKIGQVLYNLIGNAVNYTGEDKAVFVRLERVYRCAWSGLETLEKGEACVPLTTETGYGSFAEDSGADVGGVGEVGCSGGGCVDRLGEDGGEVAQKGLDGEKQAAKELKKTKKSEKRAEKRGAEQDGRVWQVRFSVTDTGAGISKEDMATIWERYYRSAEAHKRPVKGTGLGLSIVKTILEKHNFECGVYSEEGRGSTFFVYFPVIE